MLTWTSLVFCLSASSFSLISCSSEYFSLRVEEEVRSAQRVNKQTRHGALSPPDSGSCSVHPHRSPRWRSPLNGGRSSEQSPGTTSPCVLAHLSTGITLKVTTQPFKEERFQEEIRVLPRVRTRCTLADSEDGRP